MLHNSEINHPNTIDELFNDKFQLTLRCKHVHWHSHHWITSNGNLTIKEWTGRMLVIDRLKSIDAHSIRVCINGQSAFYGFRGILMSSTCTTSAKQKRIQVRCTPIPLWWGWHWHCEFSCWLITPMKLKITMRNNLVFYVVKI